jgi:hypothetical protein
VGNDDNVDTPVVSDDATTTIVATMAATGTMADRRRRLVAARPFAGGVVVMVASIFSLFDARSAPQWSLCCTSGRRSVALLK